MVNNYFDLVKDNFFQPFANKNKRINYELLQLLNKKMSIDNLQVTKESIVNWIIDYAENHQLVLTDDDSYVESDVREFANKKIRYFVNCGWLLEDIEGLKITYQFDENGIKLLQIMDNSVKDDTKSLEFSGYVYSIFTNLRNFDFAHSVDIIEQVYATACELNDMLRGLNVSIKKYLTKLLKDNESKPQKILDTIFIEYQKKVVLKAFNNFREKDNPSKYKLRILNKIDELLEPDNLEKLIKNYQLVKNDGDILDEHYSEAKEFFVNKLEYIQDQFNEIEEVIEILNKKNTRYISTVKARLEFLLNDESDLEGRIVNCLKDLSEVNDDFYDDYFNNNTFDLFTSSNIDDNSLYVPIDKKALPKVENKLIYLEADDEVKLQFKKMFAENKFSVKAINEYVLELLKDKNYLYSKDIKINNYNDVLKLFLIPIYSENSNINYRVTFLNDKYKTSFEVDNELIEYEVCNYKITKIIK